MDAKELSKIISEHDGKCSGYRKQIEYVAGRNPAILAPYPKESPDIRIVVPLARRAVDLVTGYLCKPGCITYKGEGYTEELQQTLDMNDEALVDLELMQTALTHGDAYEMHWMTDGEDEFAEVPRLQAIPLWDGKLKPKMLGFIRVYEEADGAKVADVYDEAEMQRWKAKGSTWAPDGPAIAHGYKRVPVVRFPISPTASNLFDHCTSLLDQLDRIVSENYANELAKHAAAYLAMTANLSDEPDSNGETDLDKLDRVKVFQGLAAPITDQIAFITKQVNSAFQDSAADRFERLAYEMLCLFNPNDDSFATASGIAQAYKLLGFEYLCTRITSYFMRGLQDRIALIQKVYGNLSLDDVSDTDVTIDWRRNLPNDLANIAHTAATLKGILSDETIIGLFPDSIVPDKEEELERLAPMQLDLMGEAPPIRESRTTEEPEEEDDGAAL
jgi:SPP1 family phage portal protein